MSKLKPNPFPITFEGEVTALVIEWYTSRGLPVPPEDLEACKGLDKQRQAEFDSMIQSSEVPVEKPAYGTPEFWKDWWAKKRAKEAAATAAAAAGEPVPQPKGKAKK